jgi:hypothetical protein
MRHPLGLAVTLLVIVLFGCVNREQTATVPHTPYVAPIGSTYAANTVTQGPQGAQGVAGAPGVTGGRGETGATGSQGAVGAMGERGAKGERGEPGARGERGEKGESGARGERGEKGDLGTRSEPGDKGSPGEKGERGERGEPGPRGERGGMGSPGPAGKDAPQGIVRTSEVTVLPWLLWQQPPKDKKNESSTVEDSAGGAKPFIYYFFTGLSGLVTALSPILLALLQKDKKDLDPGKPPTRLDSVSRATEVFSPDLRASSLEWKRNFEQFIERDYDERFRRYRVALAEYKRREVFATLAQLGVLAIGAWFFAYLAIQFMQALFIFICAYTLVLALAFVCYAFSRRLMEDSACKTKVAELEIRAIEVRHAHEIAMSNLRHEQRKEWLAARTAAKSGRFDSKSEEEL